jgi:hypothetical protein
VAKETSVIVLLCDDLGESPSYCLNNDKGNIDLDLQSINTAFCTTSGRGYIISTRKSPAH